MATNGDVTRHVQNAAIEHSQVDLGSGSSYVIYLHTIDGCGRGDLKVIVEELVRAVDEARP